MLGGYYFHQATQYSFYLTKMQKYLKYSFVTLPSPFLAFQTNAFNIRSSHVLIIPWNIRIHPFGHKHAYCRMNQNLGKGFRILELSLPKHCLSIASKLYPSWSLDKEFFPKSNKLLNWIHSQRKVSEAWSGWQAFWIFGDNIVMIIKANALELTWDCKRKFNTLAT